MRYGSVCSGIEAASVAWHPLGWEPAWFAEVDDFPSKVLAHHYPGVTNRGDFTTIGADAGPIDLLVGGTPCQSFSIAGLRGGLSDERGNLALEYCRLAQRLRPRWIVWENVPGVLSSNGGRDFGSILGALAELGYDLAWRVLDAQFFGVPQRRRRVFLVGYLGDWRRAAAVLFEPESLRGDPPARGKAGKAAARGTGRRASSGGGADNLIPSVAGTAPEGSGNRGWAPDTDRMTFIPQTTHTLRADGFDASDNKTGRGTPLIAAPFTFDSTQITNKTNRCQPAAGKPCHPLAASAHPPALVYGRNNTSGPDRTAGALTAHGGPHGRQDFSSETFVLQSAVRRLTPRECERLQGFPDDYTAIRGAADGPRYRALGNAMAVPVMRWIGERIQRVEEIMRRYR